MLTLPEASGASASSSFLRIRPPTPQKLEQRFSWSAHDDHRPSAEPTTLRGWLVGKAHIAERHVDGVLERLDAEEVDTLDDLRLLSVDTIHGALRQPTAKKIVTALGVGSGGGLAPREERECTV